MKLDGYKLSDREVAVMRGLHGGKLNKEIAGELGISEATVKVHVRNLMKKLRARSRLQLVVLTLD